MDSLQSWSYASMMLQVQHVRISVLMNSYYKQIGDNIYAAKESYL